MSFAVKYDDSPVDLKRRIGRAVAAGLKARGETGKAVAELLGLSEPQISARLRGKTCFRGDELVRVGDFLDVDPGQFLSAAPQFPLSAQVDLAIIAGDLVGSDQSELPFRPVLTIQR